MFKGEPLPAAQMQADVEQWLKDNDTQNYWVYSQDQWKARGETMCDDATITIATDGGFGWMLYADPMLEKEPLNDLRDLIESRGYSVMLGYHWTMHLYPTREI
jgi:hypothetical protein